MKLKAGRKKKNKNIRFSSIASRFPQASFVIYAIDTFCKLISRSALSNWKMQDCSKSVLPAHSMPEDLRSRLLAIHSTGKYNDLRPEQAIALYHENKRYLELTYQNLFLAEGSKKDFFDLTELQFYLSLITGHDIEAKLLLGRLIDEFGGPESSQRIAILKSIYIEATADPKENYEKAAEFLAKIPLFDTKMEAIRRRTYLGSKLSPPDYVKELLLYLEIKPSDVEAWFELSQVYLALGNYTKAIYSLQQILLCIPFAYNIYYELGLLYQSYAYKILYDFSSGNAQKRENFNYNQATVDRFHVQHQLALKHFLKSVELCESYSRGWGGVYAVTKPLKFKNKTLLAKFEPLKAQHEKLNKLALKKLTQILENKWTTKEDQENIKALLQA